MGQKGGNLAPLSDLPTELKRLSQFHHNSPDVIIQQSNPSLWPPNVTLPIGTVLPKTTMEVNVLPPDHGLRKEPTKKIPSSPTAAHAVRIEPPPRPKTELGKANSHPVDTDEKICASQKPRHRRSAFVTDKALEHLSQNDPLAEFDRIHEDIVGIERYFTLPIVLEPSKKLVSRLNKFNKRRDEDVFKGICLEDWELEQEVDKCRSALQAVRKEIQSALRAVVEEFFLVRGPLLGEPNRNLIVAQESFRVLEDLRATFPEAVAEFGKQAGPADGGGVAAPPNSRAESRQPSRQFHPHHDSPFQPKRARADSEEPQDLDVCVKRRKISEIGSRQKARTNSEESQDNTVCIKRERFRETCW
ncbi:uncharacterized protein B0T23DRAFT_452852 [Neurospora hispaniola]|uniref:Uncharacterized protein n=1 Tax=Neurospora hispaniola TaxID=588809 RepID=A0AAJ0IAH3_9PEZI|nr:hypothetical protein B0T23DRAFT_452852 [Neurospora hispaniola]